jgi:hypothetical protein
MAYTKTKLLTTSTNLSNQNLLISVAELHKNDAAPAPGKNFDAAPALP